MFAERAPRRHGAPVFREGFCAPKARRLILIAAILASALGFIDGTVVAIAMPAMRDSLHASLGQALWISNAYMLPLASLILVGGAFGDRFGLARVFQIGIAVFVAASLACALAPSAETLIAARAVQGIGAAFMVPGSLAVISRAYPREERGRAIGIWAAASALTSVLGPVLGGLALTYGGPEVWRLIFAINLPLGAPALWTLHRTVADDPGTGDIHLDISGALLVTVGLGLVTWALTGGDVAQEGHASDTSSQIWVMGGTGLLALTTFLWVEARAPTPMMPLSLFRARAFSAANIATFTLYFGLSAVLFFLPMALITGWQVTALEASAVMAPLAVFIALLSQRIGRLADRVGAGVPIAIGSAIVALAYAILAVWFQAQNFWFHVFPAVCLMGLGMSFVVAPLSSAVMGAVPDSATGAASGINNAVSRVAGLVAVAVMGTLAGLAYAGAGGTGSFGAAGAGLAHLHATNTAFALIAWIAAGLSALSAAVAYWGIPRADPAPSASG